MLFLPFSSACVWTRSILGRLQDSFRHHVIRPQKDSV